MFGKIRLDKKAKLGIKMATFFSGAIIGYWSQADNYMYGTLTGDVSRSGNTVTLSNMWLSVWFRWSAWGSGSYTFQVNGTNTTWTMNASSPSHAINNTSFGVSAAQTSATIWWSGSDGYGGSFNVSFASGEIPPSSISGSNLTSDGLENHAHSNVYVGNWGVGVDPPGRWWIVSRVNYSGSEFTSSNSGGDMYWYGLNESSSQSSCAVTTWYPGAYNGHHGYGGALYIASPSAPKLTATGIASTSPSCTIKGACTYRGGTSNSSSANTADIAKWRLSVSKDDDTSPWYTGTYTGSSMSEYTFQAIEELLPSSKFEADSNYLVRVKPTNVYGGTSITQSRLYCPVGVSGKASNITPTSFDFKAEVNFSGGLETPTATGGMACYKIKYREKSGGSWTTIGPQKSPNFSLSPLTNNTTYSIIVTGWNTLGLSSESSTINVSTKPKFNPVVEDLTISALDPGVKIGFKITHTGGNTLDGATVTKVALAYRRVGASAWTYTNDKTVSIRSGGTGYYDFNQKMPTEGNYEFKIRAKNSSGDTGENDPKYNVSLNSPLTIEIDPKSVKKSTIQATIPYESPIKWQATATATGIGISKWQLICNGGGEQWSSPEVSSSEYIYTGYTHNHLLFDTEYTLTIKVCNQFGLWSSASTTFRTPKRVEYLMSKKRKYKDDPAIIKSADLLFKKKGSSSAKGISDTYFVVKDSLGNMEVGDVVVDPTIEVINGLSTELKTKVLRLDFIQSPIFYKPENVADLTLSNGQKIAYAYDRSDEVYKFGIWNNDTIDITFFNGEEWEMDHYTFPGDTNITVTGKHSQSNFGVNASSLFSMTTAKNAPAAERD